MTTIVTRAGKGSPLTHTEVDTNFTNLNTAKLETAAIPLGTLQAPSVSFLNDSDTGIFCPQGGNSLAIATGAQYAITCTSTQAVGIKTANPQKALHVAGATRVGADDATNAFLEIGEGATGNRNSYIDIVGDTTYTDYGLRVIRNNGGADATSEIKHRGTGAFNIVTQEAAPIQFYTTNSPRLTITSGGNVGIGTSTFATNSKFAVQTGAGKLDICGDGVSSVKIINGGGITFDSASGHYFNNGATELMRITAAGLVGIGDTEPDSTLTIKAAASTTPLRVSGPSSEFARIDSSGRLLVGTSSARQGFFNGVAQGPQLEVEGLGLWGSSAAYINNENSTGGHGLVLARSRGTSKGSFTIVQNNDVVGGIYYQGADGTDFVEAARIVCEIDGTPGANDMPGRLVFSTTADGESSPTPRMTIDSAGRLLVSTSSTSHGGGGGIQCSSVNATSHALIVNQIEPTAGTTYKLISGYRGVFGVSAAETFIVYNNGNVQNTNNSYLGISDVKLKENIVDASSQWNDIKDLQVRNYNFKEGQTHTQIGLVAQEVELVSPGLVSESPDRDEKGNDLGTVTKSVNYSVLYMKAVKALQEAMERIETLEARLTAAGID